MMTSLVLFDDGNAIWTHNHPDFFKTLESLPKDALDVTVVPRHALNVDPVFTISRPSQETGPAIAGSEVIVVKNGQKETGTLRWLRATSAQTVALIMMDKNGRGMFVTNPDTVTFARLSDDAQLEMVTPSGLDGATISCSTRQVQPRVTHKIELDEFVTTSSIYTTLAMESDQNLAVNSVHYTERERPVRMMAETRSYRAAPYVSDDTRSEPSSNPAPAALNSVSLTFKADKVPLLLKKGEVTSLVRVKPLITSAGIISYGRLLLDPEASIDVTRSPLSTVFYCKGMAELPSGPLRITSRVDPTLAYETMLDAWSPTPNDFLMLNGAAQMRLVSWRKDSSTIRAEREKTVTYTHILNLVQTTSMRTNVIMELASAQPIVSVTTSAEDVVITSRRPTEIPERMSDPNLYYLTVEAESPLVDIALEVKLKL